MKIPPIVFRNAGLKPNILLSGFACLALTACDAELPQEGSNTVGDVLVIDQTLAPDTPAAQASDGMISSAHPLATYAGQMMLEQGGNAADAAVSVGFALSVVEPSMSGLGGRAQILIQTPEGEFFGYDAMTELGDTFVQPEELTFSGYSIVGVAGVPAGLLKLHEKHGRLPLARVMQPAIDFAESGHVLLPGEVSRRVRAEKAILADAELSAAFLEEDGTLHDEGDLYVQPDLANTLKKIRDGGRAAYYEGEMARQMSADITANGGYVTYESLANYEVEDARIVHTNYRGYDIWGVDAPGNGTSVVASLNILKNFDVANLDENSWAILLSQATAAAISDTMMDGKGERMEFFVSEEYAKKRASELMLPDLTTSSRLMNQHSFEVAALDTRAVDWAGETNGENSHHTTHHVAADDEGMTVSVTQTLGPNMGAKVMTPGLGFLYAQTGGFPKSMGPQLPGDRPRTNIAPMIITKDGKMVVAIGASGGTRIPTAIVEVISRFVDHGMSLSDAVAAPRAAPKMALVPGGLFAPDIIQLETTPLNGWSDDVIEAIKSSGLKVEEVDRYAAFARINALMWDDEQKLFIGVADPDWEGVSSGPSAE